MYNIELHIVGSLLLQIECNQLEEGMPTTESDTVQYGVMISAKHEQTMC